MEAERDFDKLSIEEKRDSLSKSERIIFQSNRGHVFVETDCGGDVNFYILEGDEFEGFFSLGPDEKKRLTDALFFNG